MEATTTSAGAAGAEIRLEFRIIRRLSLELSAGVDAVFAAPDLRYQRGGEAVEFASLWLAQPHVGLNLLFR